MIKNNINILEDKIGFIYTKVPIEIDKGNFKQECQTFFE